MHEQIRSTLTSLAYPNRGSISGGHVTVNNNDPTFFLMGIQPQAVTRTAGRTTFVCLDFQRPPPPSQRHSARFFPAICLFHTPPSRLRLKLTEYLYRFLRNQRHSHESSDELACFA